MYSVPGIPPAGRAALPGFRARPARTMWSSAQTSLTTVISIRDQMIASHQQIMNLSI
jgi:hypothetical protein